MITKKQLEQIYKRTKIGDKIRCRTLKSCTTDSSTSSTAAAERTGTVVAKYPHHVVLQFSNGAVESTTWAELAMNQAKKKEKRKA